MQSSELSLSTNKFGSEKWNPAATNIPSNNLSLTASSKGTRIDSNFKGIFSNSHGTGFNSVYGGSSPTILNSSGTSNDVIDGSAVDQNYQNGPQNELVAMRLMSICSFEPNENSSVKAQQEQTAVFKLLNSALSKLHIVFSRIHFILTIFLQEVPVNINSTGFLFCLFIDFFDYCYFF